jgi:hypothetical protein
MSCTHWTFGFLSGLSYCLPRTALDRLGLARTRRNHWTIGLYLIMPASPSKTFLDYLGLTAHRGSHSPALAYDMGPGYISPSEFIAVALLFIRPFGWPLWPPAFGIRFGPPPSRDRLGPSCTVMNSLDLGFLPGIIFLLLSISLWFSLWLSL